MIDDIMIVLGLIASHNLLFITCSHLDEIGQNLPFCLLHNLLWLLMQFIKVKLTIFATFIW